MGILRPEPMRKVGILGLKADREAVLTTLHDLRVEQVEPVSPETLRLLEPERASETQRAVSDEALRFRGLKSALPPVPVATPRSFSDLKEILAVAKTVPIDEEVGALVREEDRLQTQARSQRDLLALLEKLSFVSGPLGYLNTRAYLPFLAEGPEETAATVRAALPNDSGATLLPSPSPATVVLLVPRERPDLVGRIPPSSGVKLTTIPPLAGSVAEESSRARAELERVAARRTEIRERLLAIAKEWFPLVASLDEALTIESRLFEVYTKLGVGPSTFAVEGWVPVRDLDRLRAAIDRATDGREYFYTVPTAEEPPTLMNNPRGIRRYEFFVRFYSLPQATEWDPTLVFAIVFPIFFGIMLADWGYALVILSICIWMIEGFPGRQYLPKALRNFVTRIMGPEGMRKLAYALIPGTLVAIGLGLYFDQFFGFDLLNALIGYTPAVRPIQNVGTLLLIAGYIGVAMVTLGFAMGALKEYFHHHYKGAVAKLGGIVFTWGIALLGLYVIHQGGFSGVLLLPYVGVCIAGLAMLLYGEGGMGFMNLIEVVSHILSYTRLVGILLASVILAQVVNFIGNHLSHHFGGALLVVGLLIGAVIIVIGQGFNVVLGVFEPGIQGARLIFVEYFSKFYTGNGKEFHPFGATRRHTVAPSPEMAVGTNAAAGPILRSSQL